MPAVGALETWTRGPHNELSLGCSVEFGGSDSQFSNLVTRRGREKEREGGVGVRDLTEPTAGVNFAFSSMPNDMHEEEKQARLEP